MRSESEAGAGAEGEQGPRELRRELQEALSLYRQELAASRWSEARGYRHLEALAQGLLDQTYFSPHHLFTPMPDECTTLQVTLERVRKVTWILSGRPPTPDFTPRFRVRPYHPAYFLTWYEESLTAGEDLQSRMEEVIARLKAHPDGEVEIVQGLDDVCATCIYTDVFRCIKDADNQRHWDGVNAELLARQGFRYGQRLTVREMMLKAIATLPSWAHTCGVCPEERADQYSAGRRYWRDLLSSTGAAA